MYKVIKLLKYIMEYNEQLVSKLLSVHLETQGQTHSSPNYSIIRSQNYSSTPRNTINNSEVTKLLQSTSRNTMKNLKSPSYYKEHLGTQ